MNEQYKLPDGWVWTSLSTVAVINPGVDTSALPDTTPVSFVPMASVSEETDEMNTSDIRFLRDVRRGYTAFQENDIVFAKITPCMENGKIAVANSLSSGIGFGSTEFHVVRAEQGIDSQLLRYYLVQTSFRQDARRSMTGSAGQLRVPSIFLSNALYPLPPAKEQHRIAAAIEAQFTRLDATIATLRRDREKLRQARTSLLKAAVEGTLTEAWREQHPHVESATDLLTRILDERRNKWETAQLAKMRERGIVPKDDTWKEAYKEPAEPDVTTLPKLPDGWCWATMEQISYYIRNGFSLMPKNTPPGYRILRINAVRPMRVNLDEVRYIELSRQDAENYIVENEDILFTRYNGSLDLVGVAGMVRNCSIPTLHPDKLIRVKTVLGKFFPAYIEIASNVGVSREHVKSRARTTAGQQGISGGDIKQLPIPLPPLEEQQQIVVEVERQLAGIERAEAAIEASLRRAEQMRQSVLQRAFSGQLVVQDPDDEPADVLLARIREARRKRELEEQKRKKEMRGNMAKNSTKSKKGKVQIPLQELLSTIDGQITLNELFRRAGLDQDSIEDVESFQIELHQLEQQSLIELTRTDDIQHPVLMSIPGTTKHRF